ncbi:hypothetical protein KPH14_002447 [Odynerus spinipes]|uniref:Uncharacterized protein n=1 Tax=Odynerus spinipes TaxID=1348599 RepID=A0AAD9RG43_9HYME|nr:hypothetical protein KPH14_002447 [Odynerus spinipes]
MLTGAAGQVSHETPYVVTRESKEVDPTTKRFDFKDGTATGRFVTDMATTCFVFFLFGNSSVPPTGW